MPFEFFSDVPQNTKVAASTLFNQIFAEINLKVNYFYELIGQGKRFLCIFLSSFTRMQFFAISGSSYSNRIVYSGRAAIFRISGANFF